MSEWISVQDRLPAKDQIVLVYFANESQPYMDMWTYSGLNQYFSGKPSRCPSRDVTHWMELPNRPSATPHQEGQ